MEGSSKSFKWGLSTIFFYAVVLYLVPYSMAQKSPSAQSEALRSARVLKLNVRQQYPAADGVTLPFEESIREIFTKYTEIDIVTRDSLGHDGSISVNAEGQARGTRYHGGTYLYTGAVLEGSIVAEVPGIASLEKRFRGEIKPPLSVTVLSGSSYRKRSDAPFDKAFKSRGSFFSALVQLMSEVYGEKFLLAAIKDENWRVRCAAFDESVKRRVRHIGSHLLKALIEDAKTSPPAMFGQSIWPWLAASFGYIEDSTIVDSLTLLLDDFDPYVRARAANALSYVKDRWVIGPLAAMLADTDRVAREMALKALDSIDAVWFQSDEANQLAPKFIELLGNSDGKKLTAAIEALGAMKNKAAVEGLAAVMENEQIASPYRVNAARALGRIGDTAAVEPLIYALQSGDGELRRKVASVLGEFKDRRAIGPLITAMKQKSIRPWAGKSLQKITNKSFAPDDYEAWSSWWENQQDR